jgi:hypothetical protein
MIPRFAALLLLGAATVPAVAQESDSLYRERVTWFAYEAPGQWFGNTRSAIRKRLGPPQRVSTQPIQPDYADSVLGTLYILSYPGAVFTVYRVLDGSNEFLVDASVTSPVLLRRSPITIGSRLADVRRYFRDSVTTPRPDQLEFDCCSWIQDVVSPAVRVYVWFRAGRAIKIGWHCSVD